MNYEIATSIAWIIITVFITTVLWILFKRFEEDLFLSLAIIFTLAAVFVVSIQVFDIIGALTIPEKTIYDMMSMYMK